MDHVDVMTIIGARPQFIKAAAVSPHFHSHGIQEFLVHTGQHFDDNMSQVFFQELELKQADINLGIHGGNHGEQTGQMLQILEKLMLKKNPKSVLVYGDTNTTLAGALAAAKLHIPVIHVEAGLRSFNKRMPEEINRICTDHISSLLLAPSASAKKNLEMEGFQINKVIISGDVMYDIALRFSDIAFERSRILDHIDIDADRYALATVHRAENTDNPDRLAGILDGLSRIADFMPVVLPVHPRTRAAIKAASLWEKASEKLTLIDPVGYLDMIRLESASSLILTDSGGVQKEAYFHQVPCVTLRDETEWTELAAHGFNIVAGCDPASIEMACRQHEESGGPDWGIKLYGDGNAGRLVAESINNMNF